MSEDKNDEGAEKLISFWAGKKTIVLPPLTDWKLVRSEK